MDTNNLIIHSTISHSPRSIYSRHRYYLHKYAPVPCQSQEAYRIRNSKELLARASNSERTPRLFNQPMILWYFVFSLVFHVAEVGLHPPAAGLLGLPEFGTQADALQ